MVGTDDGRLPLSECHRLRTQPPLVTASDGCRCIFATHNCHGRPPQATASGDRLTEPLALPTATTAGMSSAPACKCSSRRLPFGWQMSLETLYAHQTPDGLLPYAGPPVSFDGQSDTCRQPSARTHRSLGHPRWEACVTCPACMQVLITAPPSVVRMGAGTIYGRSSARSTCSSTRPTARGSHTCGAASREA